MKCDAPTGAGLALLIGLVSACGQSDRPSTTVTAAAATPCVVALAPGSEQADRGKEIRRAQDDARGAGLRAKAALERLGYLYIARARVGHDPGDYTLAQAAGECLDSRFPGEPAAMLLRGHVLHQFHRFQEAEQLARALVAKRNFVLDYGLLGDVLLEQGRLDEAAEAYQKMLDLKPFYQSYTRAAHLRWLKGDLEGAIEMQRLAIASASPRDAESLAWAWSRLATFELQASRLDKAGEAVATALEQQPEYAAALLAQGRILLAKNRTADAIDVLRRATRLNPLPDYQWALADALRLDRRDEEAKAVELELTTRGATVDPRTVALFLATRRSVVDQALTLAEEELKARADVFTLDAYAWALAMNGRLDEAADAMTRALAEGTRDGRLFLHAGAIHAARGRHREARKWLRKANALRHTLLPSESDALTAYLTTN